MWVWNSPCRLWTKQGAYSCIRAALATGAALLRLALRPSVPLVAAKTTRVCALISARWLFLQPAMPMLFSMSTAIVQPWRSKPGPPRWQRRRRPTSRRSRCQSQTGPVRRLALSFHVPRVGRRKQAPFRGAIRGCVRRVPEASATRNPLCQGRRST